ncbi:MAG: T9SS type A sorting domain-containing protein [FCB group bacterium]|nr:T9SS type A sorting domain-containing protein [FCB group bacterium]
MPYGYPASGLYVSYMRSETPNIGIDRRAYFSYITTDGTLGESNSINNSIYREGYTSCAVDPYTADPFVVWHAVTEPDGSYDSHMSYFLYHATGGIWRTPFIVIDNPEMGLPFTGHADDEFIWPQVHIGPSPISDHRRVHIYGNNYSYYGGGYNSLYLYADFDDEDILATSDLDWTVQSFPYFDEIHYGAIARINKDMIVSETDGKVVFFGSVADSLFALYSDDYGETFTKYTQQLLQELPNLINIHTGQPMFGNEEWFALPTNDLTHYNGIFTGDNSKVQWMSGVNYNSQENINMGFYMPKYIYPKIFTFDSDTGEFSFYDLDIQDTDPGDDQLVIAYDLNDDGEIDEYDENLEPIIPVSCPSWFFEGDGFFPYYIESNCKMTSYNNWVICAWHDGAKLQNAYNEVPGYEGWVEQPEICIVISDDNGETWSDIRYINANPNPNDTIIDTTYHYDGNFAPELDGMLPVNITLGDKLEILSNEPGNYHAKLHFAFMDDEVYGSSTPDSGGDLYYASIDLEFQEEWIAPVSINEETIPTLDVKLYNHPNPFNPSTTISFELNTENTEGNTELVIYNIKGQKIKTLISEQLSVGQHSVLWDGRDSNDKRVGSGIYFYKLQSGDFQKVKKMILIK